MEQVNKTHYKPKEKKKQRHGRNDKAFVVSNPGKLEKQAKRTSEIRERKYHVPMVDRTPIETPPIIVAVVGPPGTGKTTLIKSLVRRYTKQTLSELKGPITVVSGKRQRLTFIECNNDLNSMIDIAKIADLVLLMVDGNFGFEMETMEFLNILAPHGLPKILGVLTHLDLFRKPSTLRTAKKRLKRRFWTEIYQGAKLFYLSGVANGRYPDREILNLSRFISVMKFRPLTWRNTHSYMLADRIVDVTHPTLFEDDPKVDRSVNLYGYLHGINLSANEPRMHIAGLGDITVAEITSLPDPCPTPMVQKGLGRKRLGEKDKLVYAPMSDVGGVLFDKDAVYVNVPEEASNVEGTGDKLLHQLQTAKHGLGEMSSGVQLFSGGRTLESVEDFGRKELRNTSGPAASVEENMLSDDEEGSDEEMNSDEEETIEDDDDDERSRSKLIDHGDDDSQSEALAFQESDSDLEIGDDDAALYSINAPSAYIPETPKRRLDINKLLWKEGLNPEQIVRLFRGQDEQETSADPIEGDNGDDDEFFKVKVQKLDEVLDSNQPSYEFANLREKWQDEGLFESLRRKMAMGGSHAINDALQDDEDDDMSEGFEDLEAGESEGEQMNGVESASDENHEPQSLEAERAENAKRKTQGRLQMEEDPGEGDEDVSDADKGLDWHDREKKKIQKQLDLNQAQFDELDEESRIRLQGYRAGTYVRLTIHSLPAEFIESLNPNFPVILGSLLSNEERFGFLQVRIKRHRWHKKILKSNDPLIFSLGWRRFQSLPIYSVSDSRTRNRMLKYTPEHMHCFATFFGPLIAPNTGFCAVQSVSNRKATGAFRIAATGTVLSVDQSTEIVKKLKLTGMPTKIFKNTAFVRDMFNSALEVAKFEGASIRTVSGIRGQIKRALSKPEGHFRATFEDKVLMSDIIFLRAWYPIKPRKFYNPVTSLLLDDKTDWEGMRLVGEVRRDQGIPTPMVGNSKYRQIERQDRHFNPLKVPRQLQSSLPYKSKIREQKPQRRETYMQKRAVVLGGKEKESRDLMLKVMTLRKDKAKKRREQKSKQREEYLRRTKETH